MTQIKAYDAVPKRDGSSAAKGTLLTFFITLSFLLSAGETGAQQATEAEQIKSFYIHYMEAIESGQRQQESELLQSVLTPEMREKKGRLIYVTGADPLLRAQDVSDYGKASLQWKHLEGGWYEVSYRWGETDTAGTYIPVRVKTDAKGKTRITYVTPYWGGKTYGDSMLSIPATKVVDGKDGATFVETFFKAYARLYATMPSTLEQDLKQMRQTYCTPAMQKKHADMAEQAMQDEGAMDPLINCADFDALWYSSLKVAPLKENVFKVSYNMGVKGWAKQVTVTLTQQDGKYRICDLTTE